MPACLKRVHLSRAAADRAAIRAAQNAPGERFMSYSCDVHAGHRTVWTTAWHFGHAAPSRRSARDRVIYVANGILHVPVDLDVESWQ
jgi:hypothetical protein